jgi:hypothetical protein
VAQGVPGWLRPRIFLTFRDYKGGRSSAIRTGRFIPGEIPGIHFQRLVDLWAHGYVGEPGEKSPVTPPGIDPGTVRLVAQ